MKNVWDASQLGQSSGAYAGRKVRFIDHDCGLVEGTLTRSDWPNDKRTALIVDGQMHIIPNATLVEVL